MFGPVLSKSNLRVLPPKTALKGAFLNAVMGEKVFLASIFQILKYRQKEKKHDLDFRL